LIVKRDGEGAIVLVLRFPDGKTAQPVFGLEEGAGMFLWLETVGEGWCVAEISEADLAALLLNSCARGSPSLRCEGRPATVSCEDFLGALPGEVSRRGKEPAHKFASRISAGKEGDFW
jgi:hypothetical protein